MTEQTLKVLREMNQQCIDENGISIFLWMVSGLFEFAAADRSKTLFYHRHASEFFANRADTIENASNAKR